MIASDRDRHEWCEQQKYTRLPCLEWNRQGLISDVSKSLAEKCGFQSEDSFLHEFKNIKEFLRYPDWGFVAEELKKSQKIINFPFFVKSASSNLMQLEADLTTENGITKQLSKLNREIFIKA
jgi:hypothetical protein